MTAQDIQNALEQRGYNFAIVAEALGVTPSAVHQTATGRSRSARIANALAIATGKPLAELFPDLTNHKPRTDKRKDRAQAVENLRTQLLAATA